MSHTIEIKDLHAGIPGKEILKGVNLTINTGEVHAIMGPNGTGKSTLSSCIMGNPKYQILSGDILFDGKSIKDMAVDERARLGLFLAYQYPMSVNGVTNSDFVRSAMKACGNDMSLFKFIKEYDKACKDLEMPSDLAHRYLNVGFSGGEKKKAEILQLLMLKPSFAILDETDSGLDVDAVKTVSAGIEEYQKTCKGSLLIITHSTRILESLSVDYTHVMIEGKIISTGDASLVDKINENGFAEYEAE